MALVAEDPEPRVEVRVRYHHKVLEARHLDDVAEAHLLLHLLQLLPVRQVIPDYLLRLPD